MRTFDKMVQAVAYFKIIRPKNAAMTAVAVALGFWVADSTRTLYALALLIVSAVCAVGFGNVVNDICDAEADRINHPNRPIPSGNMTIRSAAVWAVVLAAAALVSGGLVSRIHLLGCALPLFLLLAYALFLKGTPLAGNTVVSLLVAYALLYGGLGAPAFVHLMIPAFLAFLLNLSREIVKDMEDQAGDRLHGLLTTASLPLPALRALLVWLGIVYVLNLFIPSIAGHFGIVYLVVCALLLPLHVTWAAMLLRRTDRHVLSRISSLIKWEMLGGMAAVAADRAAYRFFIPP
ncbi:MAG: hypothetical protein GF418_16180 [Chitinivibrionales bacterium]|nr:hypothetical protein [Chitinivibrionales bacterium]MBD3397159.1 hypothetical protein [Chitinivibrionales bacterium]